MLMDYAEEEREGENVRKKYHLLVLFFSPNHCTTCTIPSLFLALNPKFYPPPKKRFVSPPKILLQCCYTRTRLSPRKPPPPCNTTQCSERAATVDPRKKMKKKKHDVVNLLPGGGIGGSRERKKKSYIASWEFYDAESRTTSPCCRAAVAGRGRRRNKNRYDFVS